MRVFQAAVALLFAVPLTSCDFLATDSEIIQKIIARSIADYNGSCPCPYSVNGAGHACGNTSAYSQSGGADPICYASQVTQEMIKAYRII